LKVTRKLGELRVVNVVYKELLLFIILKKKEIRRPRKEWRYRLLPLIIKKVRVKLNKGIFNWKIRRRRIGEIAVIKTIVIREW